MERNNSKKPGSIDVSVKLPKDAVFRILRDLLDDLEVCSADPKLHAALRARDVKGLLEACSRYDARSIIDRLGNKKCFGDTFARLYQVGALIKKFPFPKIIDTYTPALKKFLEAEQQCKLFNTQNYRALIRLSKDHPDFFGVIEELRSEIRDLIGAAPEIEEVYINGQHGPGQTAGGQFMEGKVTSFFKFTTLPYTVTANALSHAKAAIEKDPRWIGGLLEYYRLTNGIPMYSPISMEAFWVFIFKVIDCSVLTSVPKTALIDRFIAMEATMNVWLQLGVDRVLRSKLLKWGYDLNDQRLNQELARIGSLYGSFATIDLAGASDTVSLMICYLLLPPEWMSLLLDLRMEQGNTRDGITHKFHKLSSMGNGFTFAIESLVFGACCRVAMKRTGCHGKSAVYGDDIVCPTKAAPYLINLLELCGFKINDSKSFIEGPFRESCGKDFFIGHDVRPIFITKEFSTVPSLFHLANSFKLYAEKHGRELSRLRQRLLTWIPSDFRTQYRGPSSESTDTHLFSDEPLQQSRNGYRYYFKLVERPHQYKLKRIEGFQTFHLRKLMASLRGNNIDWFTFLFVPGRPIDKWDWRKKFSGGCVFDITRRDRTFFKAVRTYLPDKVEVLKPLLTFGVGTTTTPS